MSNKAKELLDQILKDKEIQSIEDLVKKIDSYKDEDADFKPENLSEYLEKLKQILNTFQDKNTFKPGDIILWKEGLNYKRLPRKSQPAIVVEVLKEPIIDPSKDAGSAYFLELLDIKIGLIHPDDNIFLTYYTNSQRFKHLN